MIAIKEYLRQRAVEYARRWAFARSALFYDFTGIGGDCTNFVSQCVLAGSCVMNFTPDFGWYFRSTADRAPAWTGVEAFWSFFTGAPDFVAANGGIGPFGREANEAELLPGDVVQLGRGEGEYYHTLLVTGRQNGELLVAAHSDDALDRPLSSYTAPLRRFLHIRGVAFEMGEGNDCFERLYRAPALS
ncbi:MAG: amidase domain-containing protein [Clostridia bacterium]|nr:amidase domain-containing protein [Clostridia bacterium]MBQ8357417.1 amidase domain-containing protein [Clostridia bacterium]